MADPVSGRSYGVEVRRGPFMYPSLVSAESPVVRAIARASAAMLGAPAETSYASNAFDQGYLNHIGIPTANYGAGEDRLRTPISTWPRSSAPLTAPASTPS